MLIPGPEGRTVSREGMVIDREAFEKMKDEFYELRGWDAGSGFPTQKTLDRLGLKDVAEELRRLNLVR